MRKKISLSIIQTVTIFIVLSFQLSGTPLLQKIKVGYYESPRPYLYINEKGEYKGIFPEIIEEASQIKGVEVEYIKLPPLRAKEYIENGKIDVIMPVFKQPDKTKQLALIPSIGITITDTIYFCLDTTIIENTLEPEELAPYKIGLVKDYYYGDQLNNMVFPLNDESISDEQLVDKLLNHRFDIGIGERTSIESIARKKGVLDRIKFLSPPVFVAPLYIGFSKSKPELFQRFSAALREIYNTGKQKVILGNYSRGNDIDFLKEIVIGFDRNNEPPYAYLDKKESKGLCVDIVRNVVQYIGADVRFEAYDSNMLSSLLRSGKIDAVLPVYRNNSPVNDLYFIDKPIFEDFYNRGVSKNILYLAFSIHSVKNYKKLSEYFSNAITQFRKTRQYINILKKYTGEIRLAAENISPYCDASLPKNGPLTEIVVAAFARVNIPVTIDFMSRTQLLEQVNSGRYWAGFAVESTPLGQNHYLYSNPITKTGPITLYKKKNTVNNYKSPKDLSRFCTGIIHGYSYGSILGDISGLDLLYAEGIETLIDRLLTGTIDFIIADSLVVQKVFKRIPESKKNLIQGFPVYPNNKVITQNLFLIFSKQIPHAEQLRADFNRGLKEILDDGTFFKILKRHGVSNEIQPR